jgi:hypothetical protein
MAKKIAPVAQSKEPAFIWDVYHFWRSAIKFERRLQNKLAHRPVVYTVKEVTHFQNMCPHFEVAVPFYLDNSAWTLF